MYVRTQRSQNVLRNMLPRREHEGVYPHYEVGDVGLSNADELAPARITTRGFHIHDQPLHDCQEMYDFFPSLVKESLSEGLSILDRYVVRRCRTL